MNVSNIYSEIPKELPDELFEEVIRRRSFKLERIISKGHSTPKGEWYDQDRDEWVILLKGGAGLLIEGEDEVVVLKPGDYIHLPAHLRHRIEWTDPGEETVWLALHYQSDK
ncbi:MAG: cupin domain-containing protein [Candidatus Hydrothermarchaeaceae archaeon]